MLCHRSISLVAARARSCGAWAMLVLLAGCSGDTDATSASVGEPMGEATVAPIALEGLSCQFQNLTFTLPESFEHIDSPRPPGMPAHLDVAAWRVLNSASEVESMLTASSMKKPDMVAGAKADMRQLLVDHSAGTTDSLGIKIQARSESESTTFDGVGVTHFKWFGKGPSQQDMGGTVFGFVNGETAYVLLHMMFGGDPEQATNELMKHLEQMQVE